MLALSISMVRPCAPRENTPAGCSKRLSSKAAASEDPEAFPLGYVEALNDTRTPLADFFSILLVTRIGDGYAHHDLLAIQGVIEQHGECTLHKSHGLLIDPIQSGALHHFGLHQFSRTGHDGFDQDLELACIIEGWPRRAFQFFQSMGHSSLQPAVISS